MVSIYCGLVLSKADEHWRQMGIPVSQHFDTLSVGSNPQNFNIKQDHKGFIYIGNGAGILIYDGVEWQNVSYGDQQAFRDFEFSADGKIYTGTSGDLGYFSADSFGSWKFTSLLAGSNNIPDIAGVYRVLKMGPYVFYTTQSHLFYYHPEHGMRWVSQAIYPIDLIVDKSKVLISTQDKKLFHFDPSIQTLEPLKNNIETEHPLIKGFTSIDSDKILAYSKQKLFIKDNQTGLRIFETEIDGWLAKNVINYITQLPDKSFAIATLRGGLAIISRQGKINRYYNTNHGLKTNDINNVFIDRENNYWLSSSSDGVSRVELNLATSYFTSSDQHLLSAATVEFDDKILMGALDGLFELKASESALEQAKFKKLDYELELVMSFLSDQTQLLVGHSMGISSLTIDHNREYHYSILHDGRSQQGGHIRQLIRSKLNPDFAYGASNNGIIQLQKKQGKWQSNGLLDHFNDRIYMINEDSTGTLWLGANNGQIYYLENPIDWQKTQIHQLDYPRASPPTMASTFGLGKYSLFNNGVGDKIKMLASDGKQLVDADMADWQKQGVSSIMLLHQRHSERAWFSTWVDSLGIDRVGMLSNIGNKQYQIDFSALDHLQLQFTLGIYESQEGVLWINSKGKVIRYNTKIKSQALPLQPPVLSRLMEIGNDKLLFVNNRLDRQQTTIELQPEQNTLRFHYTSAEYQHGQTSEFRYQLDGKQDVWSAWRSRNRLEITNLAAGRHQLNLQYRINPKAESPVLSVILQHLPFWYQSWWGIILILLLAFGLVIGLGILIARNKNKILSQKARELESQVFDRTQLIQQQYEKMQEQNEQLQQMDEAKNRFFTNISHEFRTPLSLSIGPLKEVIARGKIEHQQDINYLKLALKNNLHMMSLLGQVLDINKLEAKGMPIKIVEMNLAASLQYCIQRFQQQADKQKLEFKTIGFENKVNIIFDADHFEKIILNLISNAVKYSPRETYIEVGINTNAEQASVWIKDQGAGIGLEDQAHIFDRFYQGKKSSHTIQPGTGIGLALVKEILDLHKLNITVVSQRGEGACFTITLPINEQHYSTKQLSENDVDSASRYHSPWFNSATAKRDLEDNSDFFEPRHFSSDNLERLSKTVLVIDDNEELRGFIRSILQLQYQILEADNGRIGLQVAMDEQPDVIVSDVMMPVMDGFELAQKLKSNQQTSHIPLILLTAKSGKRDIVEGLHQGADDYLGKPFDSAELCARIGSQITQKERIADQLIKQFKEQAEKENASNRVEPEDKFSSQLNSLLQQKIDDETFDVEQMCRSMNTTRSTLFRNIKKRFNCTPKQLLKNRRLEFALQILKSHTGTVSEVAYAVGFQSLSSFSRAFNEYYRVPPTRFEEIVDKDNDA